MTAERKPDYTTAGTLIGLASDAIGPYWLSRIGSSLRIEDPAGLVAGPFEMIGTREGMKAAPSLVAGSRSVLYMAPDRRLYLNDVPVIGLGAHTWEGFCGASLAPGVSGPSPAVVWAHDVDGKGNDRAYATEPYQWTPAEQPIWPPGSPLFFAGCSAVASVGIGGIACVWRNNAAIRSVQGTVDGFRVEYSPERQEWLPPRTPKGAFYGDPGVCMELGGAVHWASALWVRHRVGIGNPTDWSEHTGKVFVDGNEVATGAVPAHLPGKSPNANVQWVPAVVSTQKGIVLAWQSRMSGKKDPGEVAVAFVRRGAIVAGSESRHSGYQARLTLLADGRICLGTSVGIWVGK